MTEEKIDYGFSTGEREDNPDGLSAWIWYQTEASEIRIPAYVDGKPVTKLSMNAVQAPKLRRLFIPATVKEIGYFPSIFGSFEEFTAEVDPENPWLTSDGKAIFTKDKSKLVLFTARKEKTYEVPVGVRILGKCAFSGCDSLLEEVILPEGLEEIDEYAFYNSNIEKLALPDSLRVIGEYAFYNLESSILDIRLSKNLEAIKDNAFLTVRCVNELYIHSKLREIGKYAFPRRVNSIKADDDNEIFAAKDGMLYSKNMKELFFASMEVGGKVVIPEDVEIIKDSVFSRNDKITEVVLPARLHTIEDNAFQYCYNLRKINLENVNKIGSSAFNATAITEAEVCAGYINCFGDCSKLKNLTLKNTKIIGDFAFSGCRSLKEITLLEGLEKIEMNAFSDTPLNNAKIPKSATKIGDFAFDAELVEIYDTEQSPVSRGRAFSNKDHLLIVRSKENDEVKFAVPVYRGEPVDRFNQLSDEIIMTLFNGTTEAYDYTLYDLVFRKTYNGKNISGKFMAAHYRLKYPIGLSGEARKMYSSYIDERAEDIVSLLIKKKDFDIEKIRDFPYLGRIKAEGLDRLIAVSEELERTELAEWLKSYRENKADYSADSFGGQETVEENKLASEENEERLKNILWKKVFDKYQLDAEKGNCSAQYELATLYEKGKGVTRDEKLAAEWMTKSADQGYVYAQVKLGMYYEDGVGVEKSYEKAFEQFEKAAEQRNEIAQFKAGVCYALDRGVQGDIKKAAELFKKSADQGLIIAQFNIALCYECGEGVEQDYEKAFEWYTKAAEQNNWDAYDRLGRLYENGNGIEKDINKAAEMYTMAAENGSADGMENLARCYEEGLGVEKDAEKAKEWREKAGITDR